MFEKSEMLHAVFDLAPVAVWVILDLSLLHYIEAWDKKKGMIGSDPFMYAKRDAVMQMV